MAKKNVFVSGYDRTRKGKTSAVTPHFRHALVKQGKVVGFIKVDKFRGARLAPIKPSQAFRQGLKELQHSPSWRKKNKL